MPGKFGKIAAGITALLAVLALTWVFSLGKAQLETAQLVLTLAFTALIPLLGVFMMLKKERGYSLAMLYGVAYLVFGASTVFRTMNSSDAFMQVTMQVAGAAAVLGLILIFASVKAKKEGAEEQEEEAEQKPNPFTELRKQREAAAATS